MSCETKLHIDTKNFNKRLEYKNLSLFDIYEHLYPEQAKACKSGTDKNSAIRKIRNWQDGYSMPKTLNDFFALCELLDCDAEYLIGKQNFPRRDSLDAQAKTGLCSKAIDNLDKLQHSNDVFDAVKLQCINALLSSQSNIDEIISSLAHLVYTIDPDEIDTVEITYNVNTKEDEQEFIDRIASAEFNFLLKYKDLFYLRNNGNNFHLNSIGLDLLKKLEAIRNTHKSLRKEYIGNVEVHLDYDTCIEDDNTENTFDWYENKFNKELANPNITVSFCE